LRASPSSAIGSVKTMRGCATSLIGRRELTEFLRQTTANSPLNKSSPLHGKCPISPSISKSELTVPQRHRCFARSFAGARMYMQSGLKPPMVRRDILRPAGAIGKLSALSQNQNGRSAQENTSTPASDGSRHSRSPVLQDHGWHVPFAG
jgi:hypothetical protein